MGGDARGRQSNLGLNISSDDNMYLNREERSQSPKSPTRASIEILKIKEKISMVHQIKKNQIKFNSGLRCIDLRKNKLGDRFLHNL